MFNHIKILIWAFLVSMPAFSELDLLENAMFFDRGIGRFNDDIYDGYDSQWGYSNNRYQYPQSQSQSFGYGYVYDYSQLPLRGIVDGYMGYGYRGGYGGPYEVNYGGGYGFDAYAPFQGLSTRYGDGGYGDKNFAPFNLNTCTSKDQKDCTQYDPDAGKGQWRFLKNIGWRKMSNYGAARTDWWQFKRSVPLPFNYFDFPRF